MNYSKRLTNITHARLQAALDQFSLGTLVDVRFIQSGHFGQNLFVSTTAGEYVFRGNPYRAEQFAKEQFFARLIAETTSLQSPWPYHHSGDTSIFGWEFAVMPKLPGEVSENPGVPPAAIPPDRQAEYAFALGGVLAQLQFEEYPETAVFDPGTGSLRPMPNGYVSWAQNLLLGLYAAASGLATDDRLLIESWIEQFPAKLSGNFSPRLCHADFHSSNLLAQEVDNRWVVSGVIDLASCHIGHPESDLARQFCMFAESSPHLTEPFLTGYFSISPDTQGWKERLAIFVLHDRLKFWEFGIRRNNSWWSDTWSFADYLDFYVNQIL